MDATDRPSLKVDFDPRQQGAQWVEVCNLDADLVAALNDTDCPFQSILRVSVAAPGSPNGGNLPDVSGRYQLLENAVRFVPHFPFERGLSYRARFDPRLLGRFDLSNVLTLTFSFPHGTDVLPPEVERIFPSGDSLPENLLRFYVRFSKPMRRGRADAEVSLLGPDGAPAPDTLYRAPVELWDRSMQCLTILLDPGRLKRGVGPNRELGPPLKSGQAYTLVVGAGMTDLSGGRLPNTVGKRFRVTDAVREPIAIELWKFAPPKAGSRQPLVLMFPAPLDWALLAHTITIATASEQSIAGRIAIDQCERRWTFTPATPWAAGFYNVLVASCLEDVCGNNLVAAFDGPVREGSNLKCEAAARSIPFQVT